MNSIELIAQIRSGVAEIAVERNREVLGNGTAFLVDNGLVTNSHVIRPAGRIDTFRIRFDDSDDTIRYLPKNFYDATASESPSDQLDYAFIQIEEPEFENRYRFKLGDITEISVGSDILFLGFPFGMPQLTAHRGYVSSIHDHEGRDIIQVDGSVNGGNSGGPLVELNAGNVVGIITRSVTGIVEQEFNNMISTLGKNREILENTQAVMQIGGIDPIQGLAASQAAMEQIAVNLKRSANVGIGYAFSIAPVKQAIEHALSA